MASDIAASPFLSVGEFEDQPELAVFGGSLQLGLHIVQQHQTLPNVGKRHLVAGTRGLAFRHRVQDLDPDTLARIA